MILIKLTGETFQPVSKITHQCNARVMYRVASKKSKKGGHHTVEFTKYGKRDCSCIGHNFLEKKGEDMFKDCRHKKMNTMYTRPGETRHQLELMAVDAMIELTRRGRPATNAWGWIYCQFPKYYNPIAVHCTGCPLYPTVCNIHKIRVPGKRNKSTSDLEAAGTDICRTQERGCQDSPEDYQGSDEISKVTWTSPRKDIYASSVAARTVLTIMP